MRRSALLVTLAAASLLMLAPAARADRPHPESQTLSLGVSSEQAGPAKAQVRAHIDVARTAADKSSATGKAPLHSQAAEPHASIHLVGSATTRPLPNPFPPLAATAPILRADHPAGPGSFWYPDGNGHACLYAPDSVLPCFTVVAAGGAPGAAAVSPAGIAASVGRRIPLVSGAIETSPARSGLTGAPSWFWMDPAPQRRELSVSLAGEAVKVVADPMVEWRFGDGANIDGGSGVPYQPGAVPSDAVTHVYETRCLPGDQGHDPYVLGSCGQDGYGVEALVVWRISYQAAGPVAESGTLPTRTTTSSVAYPVSEARAFLVAGGSS